MGSKTKKTTTTRELPSWVTDASKQAIGMGQNIANREYQGYTGDRIAGLSQNEQLASERARTGFGSANDYFSRGAGALGGLQSWTQADHGAYMNPYISQVVDNQMRGVGRQFDTKKSELQRTAGMRSAFGGGRQAMLEGQLDRSQLETTGDIYAAGYGSAYDRAQNVFAQEQQRKIAEAGAYGALGAGQAGVAGQEIDALSRTGLTERTVDQAQRDFDYGQFIEQRDWDVTNLEPLLRSIQMAKHGDTTKTKEKTSGGGLSQLAGLAATAASAYMTGGLSLAMGAGASALGGGGGLVGSVAGATNSQGMMDSLSGSWTGAAY
jgi:hypothetical protein